jgi:hypothetical protein
VTTSLKDLALHLWAARSEGDIERVLAALAGEFPGVKWRPVGDQPNNIGTIRVASDPALAFIERITNAMDAMSELGHAAHPGDHPATPAPPRSSGTACRTAALAT